MNTVSVAEDNIERVSASKGNQMKFYREEDDCWYKADYLGHEGLSEYVAAKLLDMTDIPHASYEPCQFLVGKRQVTGCKSRNFLSEGETLVSAAELIRKYRDEDIAKTCAGMELSERITYFVDTIVKITGCTDFPQYLTDMLCLDAITKNDDRHFNNISFIVDREGSYRMTPIYDNGGAFLSDTYTYGEPEGQEELERAAKEVQAKPFSTDFDEQLDAMEELYGSSRICLPSRITFDREALSSYYPDRQLQKVENLIRESRRKYQPYFCNGKPLDIGSDIRQPDKGLEEEKEDSWQKV
jgi:hypothetical protein